MEAVRLWRMLYDTADEYGRRMYTLEEAARKVEVSKKTLDDYFIQMRFAHQFCFNIERYRDEKVGVLRQFVRIGKAGGMEALQNKMPEYIIDMDTDKYWQTFEDI